MYIRKSKSFLACATQKGGANFIYYTITDSCKFANLKLSKSGASTKLLFVNFGTKEQLHCLKLIADTRNAGIASELYPDQTKLNKQMAYADSKAIPYVAIIGEQEINENLITLKNLSNGEQQKVTLAKMIELIAND
jgi:histidyl-tRNA synthetase